MRLFLILPLIFALQSTATNKPIVFITDDFYIHSKLWYENPTGLLDELDSHSDDTIESFARSYAKNCDCIIARDLSQADYVLIVAWYDLEYKPKLAEKRYVLLRASDGALISKGLVRRTKNIISDSCKAIKKD